MKLRMMMVALAMCLGTGCGELEDPDEPELATAPLVSTGSGLVRRGGTVFESSDPNDPARVERECGDAYRTCVVNCGLNSTRATRKCGNKCDQEYETCISIVIE